MIAVQALEKRTTELTQKDAQIAELVARLEALELRQNQYIQPTGEKSVRQQHGRFEQIKLTGENRCHRTFASAVGSVHPALIGAIAAVFAQSVHQALCRMGFDTLPLKTTVLRPDKKFLKKNFEF